MRQVQGEEPIGCKVTNVVGHNTWAPSQGEGGKYLSSEGSLEYGASRLDFGPPAARWSVGGLERGNLDATEMPKGEVRTGSGVILSDR